MVDPRIIAYVRQQQGRFSDEQITTALRKQGYPESLITSALAAAKEPSVADSKLLQGYVRSYLQQGYTEGQIRQGLLEQGYANRDINRALRRTAPHKSHSALILFPLLAILILIGGYFLLPETTHEVPVVPDTTEHRLSDIIDNFLPLAKNNPSAAIAYCERVVEEDRPRCFNIISQESGNPSYCRDINADRERDYCFLEFIYDGNLEYCSELALPANIEYCDTVKDLLAAERASV